MQGHKMEESPDTELVVAARKGDLDAFAVLVERYRGAALRVAYGIAGNEAEDAVQDGFVKAYRNLDTFRIDAAFRPWLFTIIANEARNRRRSRSRRDRLDLQVREQPSRPEISVADAVAEHEQRRHLAACVARLPDRYREVVALRYFAELTEGETAQVLSCPVGTVKSRLSRALDQLRSTLAAEPDDEVTT
jgi:RNA polymerase sigma-70 factor (ECF subfamily)